MIDEGEFGVSGYVGSQGDRKAELKYFMGYGRETFSWLSGEIFMKARRVRSWVGWKGRGLLIRCRNLIGGHIPGVGTQVFFRLSGGWIIFWVLNLCTVAAQGGMIILL